MSLPVEPKIEPGLQTNPPQPVDITQTQQLVLQPNMNDVPQQTSQISSQPTVPSQQTSTIPIQQPIIVTSQPQPQLISQQPLIQSQPPPVQSQVPPLSQAQTMPTQIQPQPTQPLQKPAAPQSQMLPPAPITATIASSTPPLKQRLQDLVNEVDPDEQLDADVEEVLLDIAGEFIENVVSSACAIAKHRNSTSLEVDDVKLCLERKYGIWIPGFGESKPIPKRFSSEAHRQRMALIHKQDNRSGDDVNKTQKSK